MEFKKDDNEIREDENEIQWQKEQAQEKRRFDFEAFLGPEETLDDKVTDVMDGKDLLEPDAFGAFSPDYIPRRPGDGEHGRHEAPEPENFQPEREQPAPERPQTMDPNDPRYAAPERPRVVVANPRPKEVYVTPPVGEDYDGPPARTGMSEGKKWLVAIAITLVVVVAALIALINSLGGSGDDDEARSTPAPTSPLQGLVEDLPTPTAPPDNTAEPTKAPQKQTYTITVTAGSGGSVSPSGAVSVEEGGSVTFAITPSSGYTVSQLLVDGSAVSAGGSYTFTDVTDNHTIYAVFQPAATATPDPTPSPTVPPTPEPTLEPTPEPTEPPSAAEQPDAAPEQEPEESAGE